MAICEIEIEDEQGKRKVDIEYQQISCKFCGSTNIVKNGHRRDVQYWLCRTCDRGFVANKALPKMQYKTEDIGNALYHYYTGGSLNEIRGGIEQNNPERKPSDSTIYEWLSKFSKIATDEANRHHPKVGDHWVADETVLDVNGKNYWLWDIIDADTRFLLATHLSDTRTTKDAQKLMQKAYERAGKAPKTIATDKLRAYLDGIELTFGSNTKHRQGGPFDIEDNTNLIERWHGSLKDRTKIRRGFKHPETANMILDGWLVYYNFFRPHEGLDGKTPAEVSGIKYPYKNWLEVVNSQSPLAGKESVSELSQPIVIPVRHREVIGNVRPIRKPKRQVRRRMKGRRQSISSLTIMR